MNYDGGKNGDGVFHRIINQMPPHRVYIELFLGSGAIMRRKRPASVNIGVELDPVTLSAVSPELSMVDVTLIQGDALAILPTLPAGPDVLIYADPPYLMETRSCKRPLYRCEFGERRQHKTLLSMIEAFAGSVVISGYASSFYSERLRAPKWRTVKFMAGSRGGPKEETLWCNFPAPSKLHDYRFLGEDFTDRQRIGRKIKRFADKLAKLPTLERAAILASLPPA